MGSCQQTQQYIKTMKTKVFLFSLFFHQYTFSPLPKVANTLVDSGDGLQNLIQNGRKELSIVELLPSASYHNDYYKGHYKEHDDYHGGHQSHQEYHQPHTQSQSYSHSAKHSSSEDHDHCRHENHRDHYS